MEFLEYLSEFRGRRGVFAELRVEPFIDYWSVSVVRCSRSSPVTWCTSSSYGFSGVVGQAVSAAGVSSCSVDRMWSGSGFAGDVQAEVAPGFRPFVVLICQRGADEADQAVRRGRCRRRRCAGGSVLRTRGWGQDEQSPMGCHLRTAVIDLAALERRILRL